MVLGETLVSQTFTQWAPEWFSNWNEEDSETLKEWLSTLRLVSCQLSLPNFPYREEAARTLRTQSRLLSRSQKLSKNKRTTIAALMHLILKEYNQTRPIKDISKELSLDNRAVSKHVWLLNRTLNSKGKEPIRIRRKTAMDYLHEHAGKLTDDKQIIQRAESTLIQVKRAGGNPVGLAAGALYGSFKSKRTKISKEEIGRAFRISERTVYTNESRIRKILITITPMQQ